MITKIKERIEILAELIICDYATIENYIETSNNIYGIIKSNSIKEKKIGFKYKICQDRLIFISIKEMTKEAYYEICKY